MTGIRRLQAARWPAARWSILYAVVLMAACQPGLKPSSSAAVGDPLSRPEGVELVVNVESNTPIGYRLRLQSGTVLVLDPESSETLVGTTNEPDSLAIYGHDDRGLWLLWLAEDPNRGSGCFALPRVGFDRGEFIAWPSERFELPKAATFRVESGIIVEPPESSMAGAYSNGGIVPQATFCISLQGTVASVSS